MEIKQMLLSPNRFSRPGARLAQVTKIAVHYVGNAGSTALANRNYFENLKAGVKRGGQYVYGSSHYIIGLEGEIIQCIPEQEWAYCTNSANAYSISIECCHPRVDGVFTEATRRSLRWLCAELCKKYGLNPLRDIIRHYDVTAKHCPKAWVDDPADYTKFLREVEKEMLGEKIYNSLQEMPEWARPAVARLMERKSLVGDENGDLQLSETAVKIFCVLYRDGVIK